MDSVYLDNNATTFIDPQVVEVMDAIYKESLGNPSSMHKFGQRARQLLVDAKTRVAQYFGVSSQEVLFTSGATEGLNMAIRSLEKGHVITSSVEHAAVRESVNQLKLPITRLSPEAGKGAISFKQVEQAVQPDTKMIVLMAANNETGIITHEMEKIALLAASAGIFLIIDAVAILGKSSGWKLPEGVSAACFSGHKFHASEGVGCVVFKKPFKLRPLIYGGPQQASLRGGTENLAAIMGFVKALELISDRDIQRMEMLRQRFEEGLLKNIPGTQIHGVDEKRVCNTISVAFAGCEGETLLMQLDLNGVAASHGAACSSGALEPSHVLINMGLARNVARSTLRFSLSRMTTEAEIDQAIKIITQVTEREST